MTLINCQVSKIEEASRPENRLRACVVGPPLNAMSDDVGPSRRIGLWARRVLGVQSTLLFCCAARTTDDWVACTPRVHRTVAPCKVERRVGGWVGEWALIVARGSNMR